jgi:hypothetical protein
VHVMYLEQLPRVVARTHKDARGYARAEWSNRVATESFEVADADCVGDEICRSHEMLVSGSCLVYVLPTILFRVRMYRLSRLVYLHDFMQERHLTPNPTPFKLSKSN